MKETELLDLLIAECKKDNRMASAVMADVFKKVRKQISEKR